MNMENVLKHKLMQLILALARFRYIGRILRMAAAVWRGPQTRAALEETRAALHQTNLAKDALTETVKKLEAVTGGYGAAIRGLERCTKRHEESFLKLKTSLEAKCDHQFLEANRNIEQLSSKLGWVSDDSNNIRSRIEFIRKEHMYELRKSLRLIDRNGNGAENPMQPKILNHEKFNLSGSKRLNLGCGHISLADYINIDARELPGVDVVADVTSLPYVGFSVDEIRAAHLVEHFSNQALKDTVLPYWHELLIQGGELNLIAPDAKAMIDGYIHGEFSFEELREVIFGGQEYDGDFHFTMLEPTAFVGLLKEVGFQEVKLIEVARRNGLCYEFEIRAKK